jgi:uncharacterized membrane protein
MVGHRGCGRAGRAAAGGARRAGRAALIRHRQIIAVLALLGLLLSVYLTLFKLGLTGPLQCGTGDACERVQMGPWGDLFGIPVAAYGVMGYLAILVVALAGLQPRWAEHPGPTRLLALLAGGGVAFTAYLKYLEFFRIGAVCRWCVVSAGLISAILVVAVLGTRRTERG